jgi:hypothetical protein
MPEYAYCENASSPTMTPWHVRELPAGGPEFGGTSDLTTLCHQRFAVGWDVDAPFDLAEAIESSQRTNQAGFSEVCRGCAAALSTRLED